MVVAAQRSDRAGTVLELVTYQRRGLHENATRQWVARRLADVLGYAYGGIHSTEQSPAGTVYFVPDRTLLTDAASRHGIISPMQLFGGVVPHEFVATKSITHRLVEDAQEVPHGWSFALGAALDPVVLPGWTAFCQADAARAGRLLLADGQAMRVKPGHGIGGSGQSIVASEQELDAALRAIDAANLQRAGVVLELDLASAQTFSVGTLHVGDLHLAYCGTQWQTRNHAGHNVYGGSRLHCLRGDLDSLLRATKDSDEREAVAATARYDAEVSRAFPQFFASRRNYDVVIGQDARGITRCGVLEQSWRVGGASPAEVRALAAMSADPSLQRITTSSHELYALAEVPDGAEVSFRGDDPVVGTITKFSTIDDDGHQGDGHPA